MNAEMPLQRRHWSPVAGLVLVWGTSAAAGLLSSVVTAAGLPGFVTAFVSRPIFLFCALIATVIASSLMLRARVETQWHEAIVSLPLALACAVFLSWTGLWNDGSGAVALPLGDALLFIFTLGIFPAAFGPEILVRGTVITLAALLAWRVGGKVGTARAILAGGVTWISGALIILMPTWIAYAVALYRALPIAHSLDALRVLGFAHTNSYWTNFQSDRFFTGVGRQLDVSLAMSSSAVMFLVACILTGWVVTRLQPWSRPGVASSLLRRLLSPPLALLASPLISALLVARRGQVSRLTGLDIVAFLILFAAFLAWFVFWLMGRDLEDLPKDEREHPVRPLSSGILQPDDAREAREALAAVSLVGALLLGWPPFLLILILFALEWLSSARGLGWHQTAVWRAGVWASTFATLSILGGVFILRGSALSPVMFKAALTWAVLGGAVQLMRWPKVLARRYGQAVVMGLASLVVSLVLRAYVLPAFAALGVLGLFLLDKKPGRQRHYAYFVVLAFGWIAILATS